LTIPAEGVPSVPLRRPDNAPAAEGFDWSSLSVGCKEDKRVPSIAQQRNMHQAYLARHLDDALKTEKLCVVGVPEGLNVLTVGEDDIQFTGQLDLLILSEHAKDVEPQVSAGRSNAGRSEAASRSWRRRHGHDGAHSVGSRRGDAMVALLTGLNLKWRSEPGVMVFMSLSSVSVVRDELDPDDAADLTYEVANRLVQAVPAYYFQSW
jgi:hypothetical protein